MHPPIDAKAIPAPAQAVRRVAAAPVGPPATVGCTLEQLPLTALQSVHPAIEEQTRSLDLLQRPLDFPSWLNSPADLNAFLFAVPLWAMASQERGRKTYQIFFGAEYLPLMRRRYPPTRWGFVQVFPSTLSHAQVVRLHAVATAAVFERGRLSTIEVVSALLNHAAQGVSSPIASPAPPRPDAPTRAAARRPRGPAKAAAQPGGTDQPAASTSGHETGLPPKG